MVRLEYDVAPRPGRGVGRVTATLVALGMVAAAVVVVVVASGRPAVGPAPSPDVPPPASDRATAGPDSVRPTVPRPGRDAHAVPSAPPAARTVVSAFVAAWLEPRPGPRSEGLRATAVAGLADLLAQTAPHEVPADLRPIGEPELVGASSYSATFLQRLGRADAVELTIEVTAVVDPEAHDGWLVQSVERRP